MKKINFESFSAEQQSNIEGTFLNIAHILQMYYPPIFVLKGKTLVMLSLITKNVHSKLVLCCNDFVPDCSKSISLLFF